LKTRLGRKAGLQQAAEKWGLVAEGAPMPAALTRQSFPIEKNASKMRCAGLQARTGEPGLRPQQGYPLRLLLPGFEGNYEC